KYAKTIEGMLVAEFSFDRANPDFVALEENFKVRTGEDLPYGTYASTCYDAIFILKDAISAVGYNADAIKTYLYSIENRKGLSGNLTMDSNGDPMAGHSLETVKEGKIVALESTPAETSDESTSMPDEENTESSEETAVEIEAVLE
ncbi:hypothetical protein KJ951_02870, partial [Patescibacteria group bacterium]|nr:hypothetical protein [Patescibacteria group bacterium]